MRNKILFILWSGFKICASNNLNDTTFNLIFFFKKKKVSIFTLCIPLNTPTINYNYKIEKILVCSGYKMAQVVGHIKYNAI
jgi:hypothetical protein